MLYLQTCLIGVAILLVPMLCRYHSRGADWRAFRAVLWVVMADLICETATWLLNGQTFPGAYGCIYLANLFTILLQPVMGVLWLRYVVVKLGVRVSHARPAMALCLLPLLLNAALLFTNHWTGHVFVLVNNAFTRGRLFWVDVVLSFLYPALATILSLRCARSADTRARRREALLFAAFLIPPICGAVIQLIFYGTYLFLIGFAFSLLIIFVNTQNEQITVDYLTKTNNRASLMYDFERKARQIGGERRLYLFINDVDEFKRFNDLYGHAVGDRVLVAVADTLKRACDDEKCFLARLGGDEFGILLLCDSDGVAERLAAKIEARFAERPQDAQIPAPISVSVGYAPCADASDTVDDLIRQADRMMYAHKKEHKLARAT